jgi:hypothetical protein
MMTDGIRGNTGFRWWYWRPDGLAHARSVSSRARAVCGARIDTRACYPIDKWPSCSRCESIVNAPAAQAKEEA